MMNDRFKFRQKVKPAFQSAYGSAWHYWGYVDDGFVSPLDKNQGGESYQCSGLKDKNGVLIFEGDIAISEDGVKGVIAFREDVGSFVFDDINGGWDSIEVVDVVVGNIHENPELIE